MNITLGQLPDTSAVTNEVNERTVQLMEGEDTVEELLINSTDINNTAYQLRTNVTGESEVRYAIYNTLSLGHISCTCTHVDVYILHM